MLGFRNFPWFVNSSDIDKSVMSGPIICTSLVSLFSKLNSYIYTGDE